MDTDPQRAEFALSKIRQLYQAEEPIREQRLCTDDSKTIGKEKPWPILLEMETGLKEEVYAVSPQRANGIAFAYTLNLWPRLARYIEDGRFFIDNNLIENSIRPVVLGRKNYLFAGSHEAAEQAAIPYSLPASCKDNNVGLFAGLQRTFEIIPAIPQLHKLLPGQR